MHAHPSDTWWRAAGRKENQQRNCRVSTGPLPYVGLRRRPDLPSDENPGGNFAAWGSAPKTILNEDA
eukprot:8387513-Alexandrium_andersonii.AAC.1